MVFRRLLIFAVCVISLCAGSDLFADDSCYGDDLNFSDIYDYSDTGYYCDDNNYEYESECDCCATSCGKLFLRGDFLLFRAYENDLFPCCSFENVSFEDEDGTVFSISHERSKEPDVRWNPGFRVGLGWEFDESCWDVGAYWTHFVGIGNRHSERNKLHWKLAFNTLDLLAGYSYYASSCISLRPYAGLRFASINQRVSAQYVSPVDAFGQRLLYKSKRKNKQKFLAGGIHLGVEGDYALGCGFSVYANGAFSTLYGRTELDCDEYDDFGSDIRTFDDHDTRYNCLPVTNLSLGIRWLKESDSISILQQLSWENQRYFDFNQIGDGDLAVDGISYSIIVVF